MSAITNTKIFGKLEVKTIWYVQIYFVYTCEESSVIINIINFSSLVVAALRIEWKFQGSKEKRRGTIKKTPFVVFFSVCSSQRQVKIASRRCVCLLG